MTADVPRLWLVDDDVEVLHVLPLFMQRVGTVLTANSGAEALETFGSHGADILVIANHHLNDHGLQLLRLLRNRNACAQIMVLCEQHTGEIPALVLAEGIADALVKPFDVAELPSRLERLLDVMREQQRRAQTQRELEARVRHQDRVALLGTLVATLAHDIANPLSVVAANSELMAETLEACRTLSEDDLAFLREATNESIAASRAIKDYCQRILRFSREDANTERSWDTDLQETIRMALLFVRTRSRDQGVDMHVEPFDCLPPTSHHAAAFAQALVNALTNAIDAVSPGGSVWLRVEPCDSYVAVIVEDDGPGLPEGDEQRFREAFYTTKHSGTGLGTVVMSQVMHEHGGRVSWQNRVGGQGLSVRLVLPGRPSSLPPPERFVSR